MPTPTPAMVALGSSEAVASSATASSAVGVGSKRRRDADFEPTVVTAHSPPYEAGHSSRGDSAATAGDGDNGGGDDGLAAQPSSRKRRRFDAAATSGSRPHTASLQRRIAVAKRDEDLTRESLAVALRMRSALGGLGASEETDSDSLGSGGAAGAGGAFVDARVGRRASAVRGGASDSASASLAASPSASSLATSRGRSGTLDDSASLLVLGDDVGGDGMAVPGLADASGEADSECDVDRERCAHCGVPSTCKDFVRHAASTQHMQTSRPALVPREKGCMWPVRCRRRVVVGPTGRRGVQQWGVR